MTICGLDPVIILIAAVVMFVAVGPLWSDKVYPKDKKKGKRK